MCLSLSFRSLSMLFIVCLCLSLCLFTCAKLCLYICVYLCLFFIYFSIVFIHALFDSILCISHHCIKLLVLLCKAVMRVYRCERGEEEVEVRLERGEANSHCYLLFTPPFPGMVHLSVLIGNRQPCTATYFLHPPSLAWSTSLS